MADLPSARQFAAGFSVMIALALSLAALSYQYGYRLNTSVSYPTGVYRLVPREGAYQRGDLVVFCPPDTPVMQLALARDYIKPGRCPGGFTPVIKKIAASAGDRVALGTPIRINGEALRGTGVMVADSRGLPMPKLSDFRVGVGEVFLFSDHRPRDSFDSRYYGAVPVNNLQGIAVPVWTP